MKAKLLHLWNLILNFFVALLNGSLMKTIRERYHGKDSIPDKDVVEARREAFQKKYSSKLHSKYSGRRSYTKAPKIYC